MSLKNITISIIIFFLGAGSVLAETKTNLGVVKQDTISVSENEEKAVEKVAKDMKLTTDEVYKNIRDGKAGPITDAVYKEVSSMDNAKPIKITCTPGKDSLCSTDFKINTSLFSPGGTGLNKNTAKKTIDGFFTVLFKKLMVALGSLALLIMVVGAGFMIFAMGKDDNLNKGKTIFKSGLIALIIAMSSYFMVSFLSYILYTI